MKFGKKFRDYAFAGAIAGLGTLGSYNDVNAQSIQIESKPNRTIVGPGQQFTLEVRADSMGMPGVMLRDVNWIVSVPGEPDDVQITSGYLPSLINPSPNTDDFFYNILMKPSSFNKVGSTITGGEILGNIRRVNQLNLGVSDREFKLLGSYDFNVNPNIFDGVTEPYLTRNFDLHSVAFGDIDFNEYNSPDAGTGVDVYNIPFKIARFGDANLNGEVSIGDVTLAAVNFGLPGGWEQGDFNADGVISIGDVTILSEHFGDNATLSGQNYSSLSNAVPLPSAIVPGLTLLGLAGMNTRRKGKLNLESRVN